MQRILSHKDAGRCAHKDTRRLARAAPQLNADVVASDAVNQPIETVPEVETKALPATAPGATLARKRSSSPRPSTYLGQALQPMRRRRRGVPLSGAWTTRCAAAAGDDSHISRRCIRRSQWSVAARGGTS